MTFGAKDFGPNKGLSKRVSGAFPCHLCRANEGEPCEHITEQAFSETAQRYIAKPPSNLSAMLDLIDGLTKRGLLDRVQIVTCEGASVQLGPKPIAIAPLTPEQEEQKVTMPDPEDTLFGASEGIP